MKHINIATCPACESKKTQLCADMSHWFDMIRFRFLDAHLSWAFRDQQSQNDAFRDGKSKLPWPKSKHNVTTKDGKPASEAFDLFKLAEDGKALFPVEYYLGLDLYFKSKMAPIRWGGEFTKFDFDHFELKVAEVTEPVKL